ncbi:MAG: peptidase, partial [Mesorhizobium sp.]
REYRPVCARRGNSIRTFSNACEARAADYRIVGNGRC